MSLERSEFRGTPTRNDYTLANNSRLHAYVDNVVRTGKKGIIKPGELTDLAGFLNARKAMDSLPTGLSEEDFLNILKLSLFTECATDTYARVFASSARKYDQPWLGQFTKEVWAPDELMHHLPFKIMLMQLGFSEEGLDKEIKDAQEVDYVHEAGTTPVHLTTFGTDQEYFTDNWYGLQYRILRAASPEAASMVAQVKQRETLHTIWYRDMTALQIEENPDLVTHVAEASLRFRLPGNQIVPALQSRATDWMPFMGADFVRMKRDLIRLTTQITKSPQTTGKLVMEVAKQQGLKLGPISISQVNAAMNKFGGTGYGLIGEALMVIAGIKGQYADHEQGVVNRIRGIVRMWLAAEIDKRLVSKAIPVKNLALPSSR